jgi:thiamine-phosphate pyrophosphorylase
MITSMRRWPRRGLYVLTPDTADTDALLSVVSAALRGGAVLVQYRNKSADTALRHSQADALKSLCVASNTPLIINDDVELAALLGADGVHLGKLDGSVQEARAALGPGAIVGASCYDDLARARQASIQGASYIAFGAFHPTANKPGAPRASTSLLRESAALDLPRVAIGGITPQNARPLIAAGADLIAAIGAVFETDDIEAAARSFTTLFRGS